MVCELFASTAICVHQADLVDLVDKTSKNDFPRWWAGVSISHRRREGRRWECSIDSRCHRRNRSKCWEYSRCDNIRCWRGSKGGRAWCSSRQWEKPKWRGSRIRLRWVLPDENESAHQDAESKHSTAQTAEQKFVKCCDKLIGIG